jgi:gamma-glutamyltranspeptidase/glutathione hydrolase
MQFADVPVAELISKEYARRQRARIDLRQAARDVPPGDPRLVHGDTIYLTVVDKDRNCCSLIQSNFEGFGSQIVPADLGFALQNRGALFALADNHRNRLEPHKRPFHTIIPAMVTRDGKPWFCFGVMGGDMQPQGHVQVLVNLIDFQMNVQAAGDAARIRHLGSATPTGLPEEGTGTVQVESGISEEAAASLRERGHHVVRERRDYGGYQGILIDWERGLLHGASESRKDGAAVGY